MKTPPFTNAELWIREPYIDDSHELLISLGYIHSQTWYTLIPRRIYKKNNNHLFFTHHGMVAVIYFPSVIEAENVYFKISDRQDFKVNENTIEFIMTFTMLKLINNLI